MKLFNPASGITLYTLASAKAAPQLLEELAKLTNSQCVDATKGFPKVPRLPGMAVAALSFADMAEVQKTGRSITAADQAGLATLAVIDEPDRPSKAQVLWTLEVGAIKYFYGADRYEELRRHVTAMLSNASKDTDIETSEQRMHRLYANGDRAGLEALASEVAVFRDTERGLRLAAGVQRRLGRTKRYEALLRTMLMKFPESLWAANQLGRLYLEQHRTSEGIEVLEKLSFFHDLDAERLLALGDAYVNIGQAEDAERTYQKGLRLDPADRRLKDGMAKVAVAKGDVVAAEQWLQEGSPKAEVISFINMRAVLAVKQERWKEAETLYQYAIGKCTNDLVAAKLWFNLGLSHVRRTQARDALPCFETSLKLGGNIFRRAERPLSIVKKVLAKQPAIKDDKTTEVEVDWKELDGIEWEKVS